MLSIHHPHFAHRPPSDEGVARVYHYTTVEGARSIIAGRQLWASNLHYMNDYTEYTHGIEAMQHLLHRMAHEAKGSERSAVLIEAASYINQMRTRHIFATSFCESDDLLSQWRGYADGGVAIGFIHDDLVQATLGQQFHLYKCIYTAEEKEEIGRRFIEAGCSPDTLENREKAVENLVGEILLLICAFFKHESFWEEQEWRLVSQTAFEAYDEKRGFRTRGRDLIPYYKVALGPHRAVDHNGNACLPFDEMVAGPRASDSDKRQLADAFMYLCFRERVRCTTVRLSRIPDRT